MRKKINGKLLALFALCLVTALCSAFFAACKPEEPENPDNPGGGDTPQTTFVADIPADATLEYGSTYSFDVVAGLYNGTEVIDPVVTVMLGETAVQVLQQKIMLNKLGEYKVTYTFTLPNREVKTYNQKITCVDTKGPSVMQNGELGGKYRFNDEVTLPTFTASDLVDGTLTADVKVYCGEIKEANLVTVTDNKFTVDGYEGYTIVVTAKDKSGNETKNEIPVNVFAENEIEYFNVGSYVESAVSTAGGGQMAFNNDKKYVIEGEGSVHFYTTKDGKWISLHFDETGNMDFSDVYGLSYWVYNNSPRAYNLDLCACKGTESAGIISRNLIQPNRWTKVVVEKADIDKVYKPAEHKLGFSFNGDDYRDNFWEFDMYIDCIRFEEAAPTVEFAPQDILCQESAEETTVLSAADCEGLDTALLKAVLLDDKGGKTELSVVNGEIKHAFTMGKYTVCYSYIDGAEGFTAAQSVIVYGDLTMPEGYIDDMSKPYTAYLYEGKHTVGQQFEPVYVAGDGTEPNRIVAKTTGDCSFGLALNKELLKNVKTGDIVTVRYKMNLTGPAAGLDGVTSGAASDFNLRMSYGGTKYIEDGYLNGIEIGVWKNVSFVYDKAFADQYGTLTILLEYPWADGYYLTYGYAYGSVEIASIKCESALAHQGFEGETFDAEKYVLEKSQADTTLSFVTAAHSGAQSLKLTNATWEGAAYVTVKLDAKMLEQLGENSKLAFYFRVNKIGSQDAFNLRAGVDKSAWELAIDNIKMSSWVRYEIDDAAKIAKIKSAGQLVFFIEQVNPSAVGYGFEAFFDDFVVLEK
ncbi:MAG: hypothetical protein DBX59_05120 [Bacillota bacterium]|nr:MAG: hypothetical protein DBX59_05120 [Bacillota bacterium]